MSEPRSEHPSEHASERQTEKGEVRRRQFLAQGGLVGAGALGLTAGAAHAAPLRGIRGKKVLIATGEFGESLETYCMKYRLEEEGATAVIASPTLKSLQLVVHDFEPGYEGYTEKPGYRIQSDIAYSQVDPESYDGLLIPGGRAPEEIRLQKDLIRIVGHFLDRKLPVGAMCHGVMIIYTARPIRDRTLTAYQGIRPDIELLGGKFVDKEVVVDGSLVTSRGWPDLPGFLREFLKLLRAH